MNTITKADLKFQYQWHAIPPDDPRATGKPDSTLLNRHEGYEVLPFINRFCDKHKIDGRPLGLAEALKVERLVHQCPSNLRGHVNVTQWIVANWTAYK